MCTMSENVTSLRDMSEDFLTHAVDFSISRGDFTAALDHLLNKNSGAHRQSWLTHAYAGLLFWHLLQEERSSHSSLASDMQAAEEDTKDEGIHKRKKQKLTAPTTASAAMLPLDTPLKVFELLNGEKVHKLEQGAVQNLSRAFELAPTNEAVARVYADLLLDLNQPSESREVLESLLSRCPESIHVHRRLVYLLTSKFPEDRPVVMKAVLRWHRVDPSCEEPLRMLCERRSGGISLRRLVTLFADHLEYAVGSEWTWRQLASLLQEAQVRSTRLLDFEPIIKAVFDGRRDWWDRYQFGSQLKEDLASSHSCELALSRLAFKCISCDLIQQRTTSYVSTARRVMESRGNTRLDQIINQFNVESAGLEPAADAGEISEDDETVDKPFTAG
eukprot:GILK01007961.1.p1 GENE.GILK01007961.1~~GILK01007961.1.p1  ORF type:complete len:388 (-),score=68.26 GILK01007961.1:289-1452(-)